MYYTEPILNRVVKIRIIHKKPDFSINKNRCRVNGHGIGNTGISGGFCHYMDSYIIIHNIPDI